MAHRSARAVRRRGGLLAVVAALSLALVAAGCGSGSGSGGSSGSSEVKIAIPGWAFSLNPEIARVAEQYNEEHADQPPIKLTLNPQSEDTLDTSRFILEAKQGKSSEAAWFGITPFIDMTNLVESDVLEPWDGRMPDAVRSDLLPSVVKESSLNGKLYSWPQVVSVMGLAYRPSMLPKAPKTWDETLTAASAATQRKSGTDSTYGVVLDLNIWRSLIPLAISYGGDSVFGSDGYLDLTNPDVVKALDLMVRLAKDAPPDIFNKNGDDEVFKAGKSAMMIKYIDAAYSAAQAFGTNDMSFVALPTAEAGADTKTTGWSTGFALFKHAPDRDKQIATDFITFLTNSEVYQKSWLDHAQVTVYKSWQTKLAEGAPPFLKANWDMLDGLVPIPPTKQFVPVATAVKREVEEALRGNKSAQQALQDANVEVEKLKGQ